MTDAWSVTAGDVIQLDPDHSAGWGPLLCIVDELRVGGVLCYALHAEKRGEPPSQMFLRVDHGGYVVIGKAQWVAAPRGDGDEEA